MLRSLQKWGHWIDIINLLLILTLMWRIFQPLPQVISLLPKEAPPRFLHHPESAQKMLYHQVSTLGTFVNIEDLIRYLHQHPEIALSPSAKQLLQEIQELHLSLLQTETHIIENEAALNQMTMTLFQSLSPSEQEELINFRNRDSVQKIEQQYWEELLQRDVHE